MAQERLFIIQKCRTVNLDEYCGFIRDHPQSYANFMNEQLFRHIDIRPENTHVPKGLKLGRRSGMCRLRQPYRVSRRDRPSIAGDRGQRHIGFNEPNTYYNMNTNKVSLTQSTIKANSRFFDKEEDVPKHAYTMGIRPIVQAKQVLMLVSGRHKAEIICESLFGPVTPMLPASILQIVPNLVVCGDADALSVIAGKHPQLIEFA